MANYTDSRQHTYVRDPYGPPRILLSKPAQLTEEEVEAWRLKNAGNFITCTKSGVQILQSNCGKLLMCYQQGKCKNVGHDNYDIHLHKKAYDYQG